MNYSSVTNKFTKLKSLKVKIKCAYAKILYKLGVDVKEIEFRL